MLLSVAVQHVGSLTEEDFFCALEGALSTECCVEEHVHVRHVFESSIYM